MILSIRAFSTTTLSITIKYSGFGKNDAQYHGIQHDNTQHHDTQQDDTQHNTTFTTTALSIKAIDAVCCVY